jgi:hypothetical protein
MVASGRARVVGLIAVVFTAAALVNAASAGVVLDQDYSPPDNLACLLGEGFKYVAQTVMPQGTGALVTVDAFFVHDDNYTGPWDVSIHAVNASGLPTATVLALQTLTGAEVQPNGFSFNTPTAITFDAPAQVTAGVPFAIVVNPNPATSGAGQGKGYWRGTSTLGSNHYEVGSLYFSNDGGSFTIDSGNDVKFRTYVDGVIVPEPASIAAAAAVTFLGASGRRRRHR